MTDTAIEPATRVYVRRRGYAQLLEIHDDHSATVGYEPSSIHHGCDHLSADGTERVPFGDWTTEPDGPAKNIVNVSYIIRERLQRDLGDNFAVVSSGLGRGHECRFTARYGPYEVNITVTEAH